MTNKRKVGIEAGKIWRQWGRLEPGARKIARKALGLYPAARAIYDVDDLMGEGMIVCRRLARAWRPSRGPFENYLFRTLRFHYRKLLCKEARRKAAECILEPALGADTVRPAPPIETVGTPEPGYTRFELRDAFESMDLTREPFGAFALGRAVFGPPLPTRIRAICMEAALGFPTSKSRLHKATKRAGCDIWEE
jgi:hypothetical protein